MTARVPTAAELAAICRRIAPADHGGHPIYIGLQTELPPELRLPPFVMGTTGAALDLALRNWLADRWRGRGFAAIVNDEGIGEMAAGVAVAGDPFRAEFARMQTLAIACHELAHRLAETWSLLPVPDDALAAIADRCEASLSRYIPADPAEAAAESRPPWLTGGDHGAAFIRALCHVVARAESLLLERIPETLAFYHRSYGVSRLDTYRATLRREIAAHRSTTFAELQEIAPPAPFVALWRGDVQRWFRSTPGADVNAAADAVAPLLEMAS